MALPIPSLDDRTYQQLRRGLLDEIPLSAGDWTDHNPSDPGIAVLELLAAMAEMILYRLDQIPERVVENFLRMVVDPPEPVTVEVGLTRQAPSVPLAALPAGVVFSPRLAGRIEHDAPAARLVFHGTMSGSERAELTGLSTDAGYRAAVDALFELSNRPVTAGTRVSGPATAEVFETVREAAFPAGAGLTAEVTARHLEALGPRDLGASDGSPGQLFDLLEPGGAAGRPVLLDAARQGSAIYDPNPEVTVGGARWRYLQDLLEAAPGDQVFTVERLSYQVRFGDGVRGLIPPADAAIRCLRYQVVRGKEVQVAAGSLSELVQTRVALATLPVPAGDLIANVSHDAARGLLVLDGGMSAVERDTLIALPGADDAYRLAVERLFDISQLTITQDDDAAGGRFLFDLATAGSEGLRALGEPERAIAGRDFTFMVGEVLGQLDGLPGPRVRRAHARRLDDLGTVAVIVIPERPSAAERWPLPSPELKRKVYRFLDRRRLITTRLLIGDPRYREVALEVTVVPRRNVDTVALQQRVVAALNRFFDPIEGGEDGAGWPLGRGIYRSEIYHLLSAVEDVEYVPAVTLDGGQANVELAALELPRIDVGSSQVSVTGGGA